MLQGRARYEMFRLEAKHSWDARESVSLKAKELGEQVIDGYGIYLVSR